MFPILSAVSEKTKYLSLNSAQLKTYGPVLDQVISTKFRYTVIFEPYNKLPFLISLLSSGSQPFFGCAVVCDSVFFTRLTKASNWKQLQKNRQTCQRHDATAGTNNESLFAVNRRIEDVEFICSLTIITQYCYRMILNGMLVQETGLINELRLRRT